MKKKSSRRDSGRFSVLLVRANICCIESKRYHNGRCVYSNNGREATTQEGRRERGTAVLRFSYSSKSIQEYTIDVCTWTSIVIYGVPVHMQPLSVHVPGIVRLTGIIRKKTTGRPSLLEVRDIDMQSREGKLDTAAAAVISTEHPSVN